MRNSIATLCLFLAGQFISAQQLANKHLSQLPPVPDNICGISENEEDSYRTQVLNVIAAIDADVERLEKQLPTENQAKKSLSKKKGFSQQELNELTNSDDEDKGEKLMKEKMLKEHGISMEDVEDLENMSEADQKKWAENYARSGKANQKQMQDKSRFNRSAEINKLENELAQYTARWSTMLQEYSQQEKLAKAGLDTCVERMRRNAPKPIYQGEACINQKAIDDYFAKNEPDCYKVYCNNLSIKKKLIINSKKADLPRMFALLTELNSLRNQMLKAQSGINLNAADMQEISAMALVKEFANDLYQIFP